MKTTIKVSKSYIAGKELKGAEFEIKTSKPIEKFVQSKILAAQFFAQINGGQVHIVHEKNHLYINYLDVPNTKKIDQLYKF